ncbi:putative transmembrane protein INAFM2 isoform X1 [Hyposmocoma kahamanoa]|uniref:putative transmembrane protein INAFM2 isoform X1 n=1 Tax=Hyposmocoma kahamanoa TaxID=1477025 RepID=UPI000E6D62F5|nr:putative transmembrane protein INAFM2 isoform X1 [Hyposmocoma kahamanoa]
MSGKSCTSGSVRSCAGSVRLGTSSGHEVVLDALYERKRDKKTVRVLTVIIYVFCVSLAAIMLSLYYVFFWEPKDAQYAQRKVSHTVDQQTSTTPMPTCFMPHTGGGNTSMSDTTSSTPNYTSLETNAPADSPPTSTDFSPTPMDFNLTWATENNTIIDSGPT